MKIKLAVAAVALLALAVGHARAADTSVTMTAGSASGSGPWTRGGSGQATLAANTTFQGIQFTATDANNNTINGFISLPNGNPQPGGAAVNWTGTANTNTAGTCTLTVMISYFEAMVVKAMKATRQVTTPLIPGEAGVRDPQIG